MRSVAIIGSQEGKIGEAGEIKYKLEPEEDELELRLVSSSPSLKL